MTKRELIEAIKEYPDDTEVMTGSREWGYEPIKTVGFGKRIPYGFDVRVPKSHFRAFPDIIMLSKHTAESGDAWYKEVENEPSK
jgi:hypothetical protein